MNSQSHDPVRTRADSHYDLIVIGAGQGGGPLAGAFARAGKRVALIERAHVGGSCINIGCSPTKTIVASARVAHLAGRGSEYGVRYADGAAAEPPITVDLRRVRERKQGVVDSFRTGSERALAAAGVDLIRAHARFTAPRTVETVGSNGSASLTGDLVVINTGLRSAVPPIPGLDEVDYLTSTSIMELTEVPEHLVILGGGYTGLEFAQAYRRFGSRVTIVERGSQLLPHEDEDIADTVAAILREEGIEVLLNAEVVSVERAGENVLVNRRAPGAAHGDDVCQVRGSRLLVASGRRPNTDDLGLDAAGVRTDDRGYICASERLETSEAGTYVIGDVKGGPAFTHISYDDFRVLRTNLLDGGSATTAGRIVPYTVFIDPQLGAIGMTEREARASGRSIRVAKLPMSHVARALEVDETRGVMKAVVDADTQRILGARVLGIEGGEIAAIFQVAMMGDLPYTALRDAVFSHPTTAEALNSLFTAMDREG
jgi:pyruvate/2-oxoglutarate dehydrogenase complex dihydrolipoamide dehydrogenase (E3) component